MRGKLFLTLALITAISWTAEAASPCAARDQMLAQFAEKYNESPVALGLDAAMTVHECRHTVCTYVEHRWGAGVRQRVANHAKSGLSNVYDHSTYDKEAAVAWKAWGEYLRALAAGGGVVVTMRRRGT